MKFSLLLLLSLFSWTTAAPVDGPSVDGALDYTDRQCGTTYKNLWLDIVFVVDNSVGMGKAQLASIGADIETVMTEANIGIDATNPRTSRVGIVTYNANATTVADLNTFKSKTDFNNQFPNYKPTISNEEISFLATGLEKAEEIFDNGYASSRDVVRKVVVVYASAYNNDGNNYPKPVAERLKTDDVAIITVAYSQRGQEKLLDQLGENIASPGYGFGSQQSDSKPDERVHANQLFLSERMDFVYQVYGDQSTTKFGVCLKPVVLVSNWIGAKTSCHFQWDNGYLVNEYSLHKHNYTLNLVKNTPAFAHPYQYHIGLSYYQGNWYWEQPMGNNGIKVQLDKYSGWTPGNPTLDSTKVAAMNSENADSTAGWQNIQRDTVKQYYVCEVNSCDTDNYCATVDNN